MKKQATQLLLGAVITGLVGSGAMLANARLAQANDEAAAPAPADEAAAPKEKNACKGHHKCKGNKGAKKDKDACKGKHKCKGHEAAKQAEGEAKPEAH